MLDCNKSSIRIALVGECNVGKTSIARRFVNKHTNENAPMTIGVDKYQKAFDLNGETLDLTLLDMSGSYQFLPVIEGYLDRVDAVIFVYDVTDQESFATIPYWNTLIDNNTKSKRCVSKILVGNKKDLPQSWREVRSKTARNYANFEEMVHLEVSAKSDNNIELLFQCITSEILTKRATRKDIVKESQKLPVTYRKSRLNSFVPWIKTLQSKLRKPLRT